MGKRDAAKRGKIIELQSWLLGFSLLTFIIPGILIFLLPDDQKAGGLATLGVAPLIEYAGISIGIGLGTDPVISFLLTVLPCIGISMLMIGLLGFLGDSSKRASNILLKVQKKIEKYPRFKKYGVASNFFFVMILGIYIGPGVAIILGFSRTRSVFFMAMAISLVTLLIGLATVGIIDLFFV